MTIPYLCRKRWNLARLFSFVSRLRRSSPKGSFQKFVKETSCPDDHLSFYIILPKMPAPKSHPSIVGESTSSHGTCSAQLTSLRRLVPRDQLAMAWYVRHSRDPLFLALKLMLSRPGYDLEVGLYDSEYVFS